MDKKTAEKLSEITLDLPFSERKKNLIVGVIAGGVSSEREVSLSTGDGIFKALLKAGYNARFINYDGNIKKITDSGIDIAFIALHGKYGEDGTMQGLLELLKIPYTGSGVLSSALAMDKIYAKKIFMFENIPTPAFLSLHCQDKINYGEVNASVKSDIGYPVIVKPNRGGSTIGVTIVHNRENLENAIESAFIYDSSLLVEKYIKGRLLTVSIIGKKPFALPLIEIKPKSGFYDYASKYTSGLTEYIVPASVARKFKSKISEVALRCHEMLDCCAISRVDLIMDEKSNIHVLEVNTIPGMTPTSLVPKAAEAIGIDFTTLVEVILNCASLKL